MKTLVRCLIMTALVGCQPVAEERKLTSSEAALELKSSAFVEGGTIPSLHTCDGADVSPPLNWKGVPSEARSLALIVDDPDAPGKIWSHWVLFNLPPTPGELPQGVPASRTLENGAVQGANDSRNLGYGGPCPPSGTHRYYFRLYALDAPLDLPPGTTREAVLKAIQGHILAEVQLMGRYQRS